MILSAAQRARTAANSVGARVLTLTFSGKAKRTAFVALETFLLLNGLELNASDAEATVMMLDMAADMICDASFIEWVSTSVVAHRPAAAWASS